MAAMPDTRPAPPQSPPPTALRICPDCGGILDATKPQWTTMVDMVAGTRSQTAETAAWRCLLCGYRG